MPFWVTSTIQNAGAGWRLAVSFTAFLLWMTILDSSGQDVIWQQGYEGPGLPSGWSVEGGVWETGGPLVGPTSAFEGQGVAGTDFGGSYPASSDAMLVRDTTFIVPPTDLDPRLQFVHWFDLADDFGHVEIQIEGGTWTALRSFTSTAGVWIIESIDLRPYAGRSARLRFRLESNETDQGQGWYLDNIKLVQEAVFVPATPQILQQPTPPASINIGDEVTLSIAVTGEEPLEYQWRLNGDNLAEVAGKVSGTTAPTLTISDFQIRDGGGYSVVVSNPNDLVTSEVVQLSVNVTPVAFADAFVGQTVITGLSDARGGSSSGSSKETGEPRHAEKSGGSSVWLGWTAPETGVVEFSTRGSSFDTLLAVYLGDQVSELTEVASDEDAGGFFTSLVRFNAIKGTTYRIAIDGFGSAQGNIVLSWHQEPDPTVEVPTILAHPVSQVVSRGAAVTLNVEASVTNPDERPLLYQWFLNDEEIPGATASGLAIDEATIEDVGTYSVTVTGQRGQMIESDRAVLEIGSQADIRTTEDKLLNLLENPTGAPGLAAAAALPSQFLSVSYGSSGFHYLNNTIGSVDPEDSDHCLAVGNSSRHHFIDINERGRLEITTRGSSIRTVLVLYKVNPGAITGIEIDCKVAPDTESGSVITVDDIEPGRYRIAMDGYRNENGSIVVNWRLGDQPTATTPADAFTLFEGESLEIDLNVSGDPAPIVEWFRNGKLLEGATTGTLSLNQAGIDQAGNYEAQISNEFGEITIGPIVVNVIRFQFDAISVSAGKQFEFRFATGAELPLQIDISDDLKAWRKLVTIPASKIEEGAVRFSDEESDVTVGARYYRIRLAQE